MLFLVVSRCLLSVVVGGVVKVCCRCWLLRFVVSGVLFVVRCSLCVACCCVLLFVVVLCCCWCLLLTVNVVACFGVVRGLMLFLVVVVCC